MPLMDFFGGTTTSLGSFLIVLLFASFLSFGVGSFSISFFAVAAAATYLSRSLYSVHQSSKPGASGHISRKTL